MVTFTEIASLVSAGFPGVIPAIDLPGFTFAGGEYMNGAYACQAN